MIRLFMSPWFVLLWACGSVLLVVAQSWAYLWIRSRFRSWQPVNATILESRVRSYNDEGGNYVRVPVVRFSYSYQGRDFESDHAFLRSFTLGPHFVDLSHLASKYTKGEMVQARLNPDFPEMCYLEVSKFDYKSVFMMAGLIIAIGLGSYFISWFISTEFH